MVARSVICWWGKCGAIWCEATTLSQVPVLDSPRGDTPMSPKGGRRPLTEATSRISASASEAGARRNQARAHVEGGHREDILGHLGGDGRARLHHLAAPMPPFHRLLGGQRDADAEHDDADFGPEVRASCGWTWACGSTISAFSSVQRRSLVCSTPLIAHLRKNQGYSSPPALSLLRPCRRVSRSARSCSWSRPDHKRRWAARSAGTCRIVCRIVDGMPEGV